MYNWWRPEDMGESLGEREFALNMTTGFIDALDELPDQERATLELRDDEICLEAMADELELRRDKYCRWQRYLRHKPNDAESRSKLSTFVQKSKALRVDFDEFCLDVDRRFRAEGAETFDPPTEGEALTSYLEMYIDRMDITTMAVAMDQLEAMKGAGLISWYHYLVCGVSVSYRLSKAAPDGGWSDLCRNLRHHLKVHHEQVRPVAPTAEDTNRYLVNLGPEAMLDFVRKCRRLAVVNSVSPEEMAMILLEEQERV